MKEFIESLIKEQASTDKEFAALLNKANKSIDECVQYIIGEAFKNAKGDSKGKIWCGISNDPIISLIIHYYQEDEIKITKLPSNVSMGQSHYQAEKPKTKKTKKETKDPKVVQLDLF